MKSLINRISYAFLQLFVLMVLFCYGQLCSLIIFGSILLSAESPDLLVAVGSLFLFLSTGAIGSCSNGVFSIGQLLNYLKNIQDSNLRLISLKIPKRFKDISKSVLYILNDRKKLFVADNAVWGWVLIPPEGMCIAQYKSFNLRKILVADESDSFLENKGRISMSMTFFPQSCNIEDNLFADFFIGHEIAHTGASLYLLSLLYSTFKHSYLSVIVVSIVCFNFPYISHWFLYILGVVLINFAFESLQDLEEKICDSASIYALQELSVNFLHLTLLLEKILPRERFKSAMDNHEKISKYPLYILSIIMKQNWRFLCLLISGSFFILCTISSLEIERAWMLYVFGGIQLFASIGLISRKEMFFEEVMDIIGEIMIPESELSEFD